jgi:ATP-dependent helicase/nuclease subunit A
MSAPTPQQAAAIPARGNVLVAAGAGTGKTSTVTERCLDLVLRERCSIEQILMVTFTEAAAAEMRERLRKKLREATDSAAPESVATLWLAEQLALLDHAPISTLHSFCLELVRRNFHALGLDPQFSVLDEAQTKPLVHAVLDELFLNHYASETTHAAAVRELIRTYGRGNDDAIRRLVVQLHQHAQTLAAPAAWFTAQITLFSAETPDAWREQFVAAVCDWAELWRDTLTEAAELSANIAASRRALLELPANPPSFAQAAAIVAGVVAADQAEWERGAKTKVRKPLESFFDSASFLHDLAQQDGVALAEDWKLAREPMLTLLRLTQEFSAAFAQAKRELGGIDFSDQEQFALRLLLSPNGSPTAAARECREKYRFVFVDECQDINAAQDAIIRAVSRNGAEANRFLVGDVKQSIYRFRLADPRIFQRYQEVWTPQVGRAGSPLPAAGGASVPASRLVSSLAPPEQSITPVATHPTSPGQTLALTENFRSAEGLLRFINPLFRALMQPVIGGLVYDANAELRFGAPQSREALSATKDPQPRVELHLITKDDDTLAGGDELEEAAVKLTEVPDLQTAEREARLIALRLKMLKESGHQVWDRESKEGGFRPVEYPDMVVLLRGIAGRAEIFAKAFHQVGVPLRASRAGFLTALEISDVLNLLRLLDNPLQDLPLLAVLRSPLVGLPADELAQIRSAERRGLLWTALLSFAKSSDVSQIKLAGKLSVFLDQYQRWREFIRHASLTQCIEAALNETHYEALLLAEERGAERVANVRRLVEMARRFDPFQREGLFRFLQFIAEQEVAEVDHAPAEAAPDNAVRLMTIHASKGLEFPVVALAGMGGRFNLRDLSGDILLDEESGLCPKIFPPQTRSKYPSIAHWIAAQRERRALLGEELRLLYVALTRARDTLLLVGSASRKDETERWQNAHPITNHALLKAGSHLDWLRLWFANATTESDWAKGGNHLLRWKFWNQSDSSFALDQSGVQANVTLLPAPTPEQLTRIQQTLTATYAHEAAVAEPAKTTVTALRRRVTDETAAESRQLFQSSGRILLAPKSDSKLTAAEIGTAHHTFLQFVALQRTATELDLRNEALRLERDGVLMLAQTEALDFAALNAFWQSELGTQIRACPEGEVNREMPFTARFQIAEVESLLHPDRTAPQIRFKTADDFVIVQGIADLVVLRPEEIWLVDFKTDHIAPDQLAARVQHYEPQLQLYALALGRIYRRKVTLCALHFLSVRETAYLWL